jgi:predicted nucleic acid-binding Zn ribbon protein
VAAKSSGSARAQLITTRRGTWIDESLLPAARRECLEILQIASQAVGEGIAKRVRNVGRHVEEDSSRSDLFAPKGYRARVSDELEALHTELLKYRLPEEERAWEVAYEAIQGVRTCGFCGRELSPKEPAYLGAKVYVGMWPLSWDYSRKLQIGKPLYVDTVLCSSCAPEWLSRERDDVVMQLCAHCERPMVSLLDLPALRRTFCSDRCKEAYHDQLREEKKAEARKKVCEVCGEEFTATRRDAKTCSDGCKQKAYRQRKKEVKQNR